METLRLPSQIVVLSRSDLRVPDWNPRKGLEDDLDLKNLTEYVQQGGLLPRIMVWKGEGKPPYDVISGQRRLEAYRRAGVESVEVEILDITLKQAKYLARTSNQGKEVHWLDDFENLESLKEGEGDIKVVDFAVKVGREKTQVSRALALMEILTPQARQMIREHRLKNALQNKAKTEIGGSANNLDLESEPSLPQWTLTERVATRLGPLSKGRPLPEAQALVDKAIPLVLSKQMTTAQVDQWVKKANGVAPKAGAKGAGAKGSKGAGGLVQSVLAGIGHQALRRLKTQVVHEVRKWAFRLVFLGLAGLVLVYILPLALNHFLIGRINQYLAPEASVPAQPKKPALSPSNGSNGPATTHRVPPQVVSQTQAAPAPASAPAAKGPAPLWATADADYVSDFAAHFFRISYVNWSETLGYFKTRLDKDYYPAFQSQYFPPTLKSQMEEKRLAQTFWPAGAPKLLGWEGESDEYLVRGTHSLEDHYNEPPQTLSKETAGVVVQVVHDIDTGKRIVKVSLATPEQLAAAGPAETQKGTDVGKALGDGVKDLNHAVNTAQQGNDAVGKVKNLLGL